MIFHSEGQAYLHIMMLAGWLESEVKVESVLVWVARGRGRWESSRC